jgi:acyl dehydratase
VTGKHEGAVLTTEMRALLGLESAPATYEVSKWDIARFACAIGDPNPLYTDEAAARRSRFGSLIAPPTFLRSLLPGPAPRSFPEPFSHILDGGSKFRFLLPVRAGDSITVTRNLKDLFVKSGRLGEMLFKIRETRYVNQLGQLVATQESTTITYGDGEAEEGIGEI